MTFRAYLAITHNTIVYSHLNIYLFKQTYIYTEMLCNAMIFPDETGLKRVLDVINNISMLHKFPDAVEGFSIEDSDVLKDKTWKDTDAYYFEYEGIYFSDFYIAALVNKDAEWFRTLLEEHYLDEYKAYYVYFTKIRVDDPFYVVIPVNYHSTDKQVRETVTKLINFNETYKITYEIDVKAEQDQYAEVEEGMEDEELPLDVDVGINTDIARVYALSFVEAIFKGITNAH